MLSLELLFLSYSDVQTKRSFIHSGYLYSAPSRNLLEALSVQLRPKRNVLRSLQKEDVLFWGIKRSVRGSSFQVEGPTTEKALRCLSAEPARGTKSSPRAEERRAWREARFETGLQSQVWWCTTGNRSPDKCWNPIQNALRDRKPDEGTPSKSTVCWALALV